MDLLVPGIGEIIGGSQREERLDKLRAGMALHQLDEKNYWWYLDLRRYGSVPHAGFGLGFERMLMFVTGSATSATSSRSHARPSTLRSFSRVRGFALDATWQHTANPAVALAKADMHARGEILLFRRPRPARISPRPP